VVTDKGTTMKESIGSVAVELAREQVESSWEEMLALERALASHMLLEELFRKFGLPWPPDPALHREPIGINETCADRP